MSERSEPRRADRATASEPGPVFVAGNSRSGTTMVADMLGRHHGMARLRELHFFEQLWSPDDRDRPLALPEATELAARLVHNQREHAYIPWRGQYRGEGQAIVATLGAGPRPHDVFAAVLAHEAHVKGKAIAVEQTPRNVYFVDDILELFPGALVVVVVRDPRDVLLSQKNWWRRRAKGASAQPRLVSIRHWVNYHPVTTSLLWRGGVRAGAVAQERDRALVVRFEDVLADPERALTRVCAQLGLDFEPAMLDVARFNSSIDVDGAGVGVDRGAQGRWREGLSATEAWMCQRLTGREMTDFGYEQAPLRPALHSLLWMAASLPLKLAAAVLLNRGRTRSLLRSVRLRFLAKEPLKNEQRRSDVRVTTPA